MNSNDNYEAAYEIKQKKKKKKNRSKNCCLE